MATKKKDVDFAKSFKELETIAEWFDRGEPDLEEGLKKFERASELAKTLKAKLEEAENKIKEIKSRSN